MQYDSPLEFLYEFWNIFDHLFFAWTYIGKVGCFLKCNKTHSYGFFIEFCKSTLTLVSEWYSLRWWHSSRAANTRTENPTSTISATSTTVDKDINERHPAGTLLFLVSSAFIQPGAVKSHFFHYHWTRKSQNWNRLFLKGHYQLTIFANWYLVVSHDDATCNFFCDSNWLCRSFKRQLLTHVLFHKIIRLHEHFQV